MQSIQNENPGLHDHHCKQTMRTLLNSKAIGHLNCSIRLESARVKPQRTPYESSYL